MAFPLLNRLIFNLSSKDNKNDEFCSSFLKMFYPNHVSEVKPEKVFPNSFLITMNVFSMLSHTSWKRFALKSFSDARKTKSNFKLWTPPNMSLMNTLSWSYNSYSIILLNIAIFLLADFTKFLIFIYSFFSFRIFEGKGRMSSCFYFVFFLYLSWPNAESKIQSLTWRYYFNILSVCWWKVSSSSSSLLSASIWVYCSFSNSSLASFPLIALLFLYL